jgi:hypothetical protein
MCFAIEPPERVRRDRTSANRFTTGWIAHLPVLLVWAAALAALTLVLTTWQAQRRAA